MPLGMQRACPKSSGGLRGPFFGTRTGDLPRRPPGTVSEERTPQSPNEAPAARSKRAKRARSEAQPSGVNKAEDRPDDLAAARAPGAPRSLPPDNTTQVVVADLALA